MLFLKFIGMLNSLI